MWNYYYGSGAFVPATVTIPEGQSRAMFPITGFRRSYELVDIIRAQSGPIELRNSISVTPLLANLRIEPATIKGGSSLLGMVGLNARAGMSGVVVSLRSDNPAVNVPASITIGAGQMGKSFLITASVVSANTDVTITATHEGASVSTTIRLTP